MKKYRKLIFCIVFLLVSTGFVIYRKQYLQLRYNFEIGGLLDPPKFPENCLIINDSISSKYEDFYTFSQPSHHWLKVNDFNVYSAFIQTVDNKRTAIAIGVSTNEIDCDKYKCHVWIRHRGSLFSISGIFVCRSVSSKNMDSFLYDFLCRFDTDIKGTPYMFVLIDEADVKFHIPIHYKEKRRVANSSTLCIYPDSSGIEDLSIIEFISYHQLVGFTDIIVYDNAIHHGVFSTLQRVFININFLKSFSVLSWNFPYNDVELSFDLIKRDCMYRTSGHTKLLGFSKWNNYLIPVEHLLVLPALEIYGESDNLLLEVNVKTCCLDSKEDSQADKSWPTVLKKNLCLTHILNTSFILNPRFEVESVRSVNVPISTMYVNEYTVCNSDGHVIKDTTTLKYLTNLMGSKLLRLWSSGTLFE